LGAHCATAAVITIPARGKQFPAGFPNVTCARTK